MLTRSVLMAGSLSLAVMAAPAVSGLPAVASGSVASGSAARAPAGQLMQVWTAGAATAWAWTAGETAGSPQALELTVNGGKSWWNVTPPGLGTQGGDHFITGLYARNASQAWVAYGGLASGTAQTIAMTSDAGRKWTVVGHEPLTKVPYSTYTYGCGLDFVTTKVGWCETTPAFPGSEAVYIYQTTDGGRKWQLVSKTAGPPPNPVGTLPWAGDKDTRFMTAAKGWTVLSEAGDVTAPLYQTVNGGRTWIRRQVGKAPGTFGGGSGFTGQPVITGNDGAVGYTIDGNPARTVVYVTTDAGLNWHAVTPPGKAARWVVDAITARVWRLVAGNHVLATSNAGQTWQSITSNVSLNPLYTYDDPTPPAVNFASAQVGWLISTSDLGLPSLWRTTNFGRTWRQMSVPGA